MGQNSCGFTIHAIFEIFGEVIAVVSEWLITGCRRNPGKTLRPRKTYQYLKMEYSMEYENLKNGILKKNCQKEKMFRFFEQAILYGII